MAKITGIGGVFIKTDQDHTKLRNFYKDKLGLQLSEYGVSIISDTNQILLTMEKGNDPYPFFNFTVDNIEELMTDLKASGVEVVKEIETYDYGKFSQVRDDCGQAARSPNDRNRRPLDLGRRRTGDRSCRGRRPSDPRQGAHRKSRDRGSQVSHHAQRDDRGRGHHWCKFSRHEGDARRGEGGLGRIARKEAPGLVVINRQCRCWQESPHAF